MTHGTPRCLAEQDAQLASCAGGVRDAGQDKVEPAGTHGGGEDQRLGLRPAARYLAVPDPDRLVAPPGQLTSHPVRSGGRTQVQQADVDVRQGRLEVESDIKRLRVGGIHSGDVPVVAPPFGVHQTFVPDARALLAQGHVCRELFEHDDLSSREPHPEPADGIVPVERSLVADHEAGAALHAGLIGELDAVPFRRSIRSSAPGTRTCRRGAYTSGTARDRGGCAAPGGRW